MAKYKFFIGIDISKLTLDVAVMQGARLLYHSQLANEPAEITLMIKRLKEVPGLKIPSTVFGMEQTGIYSNRLLEQLSAIRANIVNEPPLQIKNSLGNIRGKNDKIDAIRIAGYLYRSRDSLSLWQPRRTVIIELASLVTLRNRLSANMRSLSTPLSEDRLFTSGKLSQQNKALCAATLAALKADIGAVDQRIREAWSSDPRLGHLMEIITSIPCIGEMTALQMIISTNEFQSISSPKQFASYAGVAPFPHQSGTSVRSRTRVSQVANKKMKSLLHSCAVCSKRFVPELRDYYARKTQVQGKNKMLVLNAIRSKLILRVYACIKQDRPYQKEPPSI